MTIHCMGSLADRIRILNQGRTLPLRHATLVEWGLIPDVNQLPGPRPAPTLPDGSRALRLPRIGADLDLSEPPIDWARKRLQALFEPSPSVQVGVLSSPGLMPLAKRFGLSLHKVSVVLKTNDDFRKRIRTLEHDRYASCWRNTDGLLIEDDHFNRWELNTLPDIAERCTFTPVKARHRFLDIRLPLGVSYHQFDVALTSALATARLDQWLKTTSGQAHADRMQRDPKELMRMTAYDFGGMNRHVMEAREIIQIRPDRDAHLLVAVVEDVLLALSGWNGTRAY